jgi:hypothetical protein
VRGFALEEFLERVPGRRVIRGLATDELAAPVSPLAQPASIAVGTIIIISKRPEHYVVMDLLYLFC